MKKTFILLFLLMLVFTSCSEKNIENKDEALDKTNEDILYSEARPMKIAMLTSLSGIDDGSFNQNIYEGILEFLEENKNATLTAIQEYDTSKEAQIKAVEDILKDYDVFVLPGYQFINISKIAKENPDKKFILLDADLVYDEETKLDNLKSININGAESGFLAGVLAASESKTKKVAVINGVAFPSNIELHDSFVSGVNYANKTYKTEVEVIEIPEQNAMGENGEEIAGNYVGSFDDVAGAKFIAQELINEGVDIIFAAAGKSGQGVFDALKESEDRDFVIGCDVDQYEEGKNGSENIVLSSAVKHLNLGVNEILESILNDEFTGGTIVLDMNYAATGVVLDEGSQQISKSVINRIRDCETLLMTGDVDPLADPEIKLDDEEE